MGERHLILYFLLSSLLIAIGCAKRIPISYDQARPNALVKIQTVTGQTCNGVIQEKKTEYLLLKENRYENHLTKINRGAIASITGRKFVYDGQGEIISEWEIQDHQRNKNLLLYTMGGAGLSFGASFFIGSLIHRGLDNNEENSNKILWGTTALGAAVGTYLFAKTGKKRDRVTAIENIREQRFEIVKKQYENERSKYQSVQEQLEKEKAERTRQEEELKLLKEKVKNKKK